MRHSCHPLFTEALRNAAFPIKSAVNSAPAAFRRLTAALGDGAKDALGQHRVIRNWFWPVRSLRLARDLLEMAEMAAFKAPSLAVQSR
jgi:hypothetical protein